MLIEAAHTDAQGSCGIALSEENSLSGGVVIACGISAFNAETDKAVSAVFSRADGLMYENKKLLKSRSAEALHT